MQSAKGHESRYGLGFMVFKQGDLNIVGHNGQVSGYTAQFAFERNSRYGVILMRNYTHGATDLDKMSFELLSKLRQLDSK